MPPTYTPPPNWFTATILHGLKRLLTLSLDRTPAAELLGETTRAWADALWPGRQWFESDVPRIAEGFRRLSANVEQWLPPVVFLCHLPARETPKLVALPATAISDAERDANLHRIETMLRDAGIA